MSIMTSNYATTPAVSAPASDSRALSRRANRNLARQIDELVAAGHVAIVRELIASDITRIRVMGAINLCADATLQLLTASSMLHNFAKDPYEHALVTRNMAFAEAVTQQIIARTYA